MLDSFKIRQIHSVYYPLGMMNVGLCLIRWEIVRFSKMAEDEPVEKE